MDLALISSRANLDDLLMLLQIAMNLWFGNGKNRFYDKQQLVSMPGGKSGFMGEHSCMDGTPTLRMNDFVLASLESNKIELGTSKRSDLSAPKPITFSLDKVLESKIAESIKDFDSLKEKHDIAMLDFQGYGKGQMKKFKCSPDGWAQMAIQLAYYRMFGEPCATYESAQTRKFKLGRTETIRSASVDSKAFCEIMEDPKSTVSVSRWKVLKIRRHLVVYFNRLMFLLPLLMLFLPSLSSSGRGTFRQIHNRSQSSLSLCCSLCRRSRSRSSSLRIKETSQRR